jgi:hypothetical protein
MPESEKLKLYIGLVKPPPDASVRMVIAKSDEEAWAYMSKRYPIKKRSDIIQLDNAVYDVNSVRYSLKAFRPGFKEIEIA